MCRKDDWVRLTMRWHSKPRGARAQVISLVNEMYINVRFLGDFSTHRVPVSRVERISLHKGEINPKQIYALIEQSLGVYPAGTVVAFVEEVPGEPDLVLVADTNNRQFLVSYTNLMKHEGTTTERETSEQDG